MLYAKKNPIVDEPWFRMGWWGVEQPMGQPDGSVQTIINFGNPAIRRQRASHSAEGGPGRRQARDTWDRHWKKFGDSRRVPMPFRRGIPFRGDVLGSSNYTIYTALH